MYNFNIDGILEMLNLSTTQHSTRQRNMCCVTDLNATLRNATQQIQHNSDTTDRNNATQHNKTDTTQRIATQHNTTQHNIMDYNTTQRNTTQQNSPQHNKTRRYTSEDAGSWPCDETLAA